MQIFDISQELFSGNIYSGDTVPSYHEDMRIKNGDKCNLTTVTLCVHNITHIDAPFHFFDDGKTIDDIDLNKCIGDATVIEINGTITADDINSIMKNSQKRLLFKGNCIISLEAAMEMNKHGIKLIGVEAQTVGDENVHCELLSHEVALLEGIVLDEVPEGDYMLNCAPVKFGGLDGALCRAVLINL